MTGTLVLVRHGESVANRQDRFAGWLDVPLTPTGRVQARAAGRLLAANRLLPDIAFTSPLARAQVTSRLLLHESGRPLRPVVAAALIERHYGLLQGRRRVDLLAEVGHRRLHALRRGWDVTPPTATSCGTATGESLRDVAERVTPFWRAVVEPELMADRCVLVVSHGNTMRVIMRHLEGLDDRQVAQRSVPVAEPVMYRWATGMPYDGPHPLCATSARHLSRQEQFRQ